VFGERYCEEGKDDFGLRIGCIWVDEGKGSSVRRKEKRRGNDEKERETVGQFRRKERSREQVRRCEWAKGCKTGQGKERVLWAEGRE
jgi:hypothetical protein